MRHPSLLNADRTALAVIDMQEAFRKAILDFGLIAERIGILVRIANLLEVPVIVTEQYPQGLGRTVTEIATRLAPGEVPIEKVCFSACGVQEFDTRLRERHVEQVMVCGIEAHVCVHQTVHDLIQLGYQVHVVGDAISARFAFNREAAMKRMASAGAITSSIEMATLEMCDPSSPHFRAIQSLIKELS
jgi:nicotinamidase-related amidase